MPPSWPRFIERVVEVAPNPGLVEEIPPDKILFRLDAGKQTIEALFAENIEVPQIQELVHEQDGVMDRVVQWIVELFSGRRQIVGEVPAPGETLAADVPAPEQTVDVPEISTAEAAMPAASDAVRPDLPFTRKDPG